MIPRFAPFLLLLAAGLTHADPLKPMKFDFGTDRVAAGSTAIKPDMVFSGETGYGFDLGITPKAEDRGGDPLRGDFITGAGGFYFSVELPEGSYDVTVLLGDPNGKSDTTIKSESRRLMVEDCVTKEKEQVTRNFTVNIRTPEIKGGFRVGLKEREKPYLHWDSKLTLEFNGSRPCVAALEITPAVSPTVVYLLGDSTVADQPYEPWNSWGQMLPRFFKSGVSVANYAESGESLRSSLSARRVAKVESLLKKDDYAFVQFGHNDMKDKKEGALQRYEADLTDLVKSIRTKGGIPVLITSMERKAGVKNDTLAGYPDAVIRVAKSEKTALIDLHAMSRRLYIGLGKDLDSAFQDGTHHNNFGSYELAKCVVEGIRGEKLPLAGLLADDVKPFDPSHPDSAAAFHPAVSPVKDPTQPDGD